VQKIADISDLAIPLVTSFGVGESVTTVGNLLVPSAAAKADRFLLYFQEGDASLAAYEAWEDPVADVAKVLGKKGCPP
jgi:hypothetical protein